MTLLSRVLAYTLAVVLFGGLVVLALAGVSAATAVLVTAGAVVALIALGGTLRGRRTPPGPPRGGPGGTMEG